MIRKLLRYIKGYRKLAILSPIFSILEAGADVILPFYVALIIDTGIVEKDINNILYYGGLLIAIATASFIFGMICSISTSVSASGFAKNIRQAVFEKIQTFSFKNIDKFSTGSLITRLTTDITNIQNTYQMATRILLRAPLMIIFSLVMAIRVNIQLSIMFFILIPILGIGLGIVLIKAHPYFKKGFSKYDEMNNIVQENISAMRVVKSYNQEEFENQKLTGVAFLVYKLFKKADKVVAFQNPFIDLVIYTFIMVLSFMSANMIIRGEMTTGNLMSMIIYATQILTSMMMLSFVMVLFLIGEASSKRVIEILEEKSDLINPENPIYEISEGSITFKGVNFAYDEGEKGKKEGRVLKEINIHINEGETIGIIGDTGSAKTSFVQLIPRLYDTSSGEVKVGGINVKNYDIKSLRDKVSFVLQKNVVFSGSIKENLKWGNKEASDKEIKRVCKLSQADEFIKKLPNGYDTILEQGGTNLSGGQKQRLCIARALLKNPKILILDDSTSAVDTKTDMKIREALKNSIPNTTKIIIAQRIDSIKEADKIIVLDKGRITGFDTHRKLLKNNKIYREVYDLQTKEKNKK